MDSFCFVCFQKEELQPLHLHRSVLRGRGVGLGWEWWLMETLLLSPKFALEQMQRLLDGGDCALALRCAVCCAMCRAICYAMMCRAVPRAVLCHVPCRAVLSGSRAVGWEAPPATSQQVAAAQEEQDAGVPGSLGSSEDSGVWALPCPPWTHPCATGKRSVCQLPLGRPQPWDNHSTWCCSSCTGSPDCGPALSAAGQSPGRATSAGTLLFPSLLLSGSTTSSPIRVAERQPRQHTVPELAGQPVRMRGVNAGTRRAQLLLPGTGPLPAAVLCHRPMCQEHGYQQGCALSSVGSQRPGHAVRSLSSCPSYQYAGRCRIYFSVSILFLI